MDKNGKNGKSGTKKNKDGIIASRKTCSTDGIGLSHYVLIDKKAK